jgi:hypothetical protein
MLIGSLSAFINAMHAISTVKWSHGFVEKFVLHYARSLAGVGLER